MQISVETLNELFHKLDISIPDFETQYAIWYGNQVLTYGERPPSYDECKNDLLTLLTDLGIDCQDETTIKIIDDTLQQLQYLHQRERLLDQMILKIDDGSLKESRHYVKDAILYFMDQQDQNYYITKMQPIYSVVASKYQNTPKTVMRSIRKFIQLYYLSLSNKKESYCTSSSNEVISTEKFFYEFSRKLRVTLKQDKFSATASFENLDSIFKDEMDTFQNQRNLLFQKIMYNLKIPSYLCNYRYLQACLDYILVLFEHNSYDDILITKDVYPIVARSLGVPITTIETSVRRMIRLVESKVPFLKGDMIDCLYPNRNEHYTNSQFLNVIAQYIKKVEASEGTKTFDIPSSSKKVTPITSSLQSDTRTIIASYIVAQYGLEELLIYVMKGFALPDDQIGFQYLKEILMVFLEQTSAKTTLSSLYTSLSLKYQISVGAIQKELKILIQLGRKNYLNTAKNNLVMEYMYYNEIKLSPSLFIQKFLKYVKEILSHQNEVISMDTNASSHNKTLTFNKTTKTKK